MSMLDTVFFWLGVVGVSLILLGVRKGWILVGLAVSRFLVGPLIGPILAVLPLWAWLVLVVLAPFIVLVLVLRWAQRLLGLAFGKTTASHVTAEVILGICRRLVGRNGRR